MIKVENLEKYYENNIGVSNISFSLEKGEILAVIGLNGAGKTTIIKCITSSITDYKGYINIDGFDAKTIKAKKLYEFLPETFTPILNLTGYEFVDYIASLSGKKADKKSVEIYSKIIDFPIDRLNYTIRTYSKGMRQKISFIAIVSVGTPYLILDEPMSGLDPIARYRLKEFLLTLKKENRGILFASHILSDVDEIADKVLIVHKGEILLYDTPDTVKSITKESSLEKSFFKLIKEKEKLNV